MKKPPGRNWNCFACIALTLTAPAAAETFGHERGQLEDDFRTDEAAYQSVRPLPALAVSRDIAMLYEDFAIDPEYLRQKTSELSGALPVTIDGKSVLISDRKSEPNKALAREFLAAEYRALGFHTSIQHYSFGNNFVAEKPGTDLSRVLLLTSHLDSVQCPGADDDGTGTVSALAIARALAPLAFHHTLRIVAFDQEEPGKIGSSRYVESLPPEERAKILGVINLEMTAYNGKRDGAFEVIDCDRADSTFLSRSVRESVAALKLPLAPVAACTQRSDHARFWQIGIPAIMVIQNFFGGDANPCYHKACDTVEGLHFDYMAALARAVASASAHLLESESALPNP